MSSAVKRKPLYEDEKPMPVFRNKSGKRIYPQIYIFSDKYQPEWLKIGYTTRKNPEDRIKEQYNTRLQLEPDCYNFLFSTEAIRHNDISFKDKPIHKKLKSMGIENKGEFYKVNLEVVESIIDTIKRDISNKSGKKPTYEYLDDEPIKDFKAKPKKKVKKAKPKVEKLEPIPIKKRSRRSTRRKHTSTKRVKEEIVKQNKKWSIKKIIITAILILIGLTILF